ncbi:MAG: NUDIX hydrolase [Pararhodobacter sp.]|nr:NUDIX hydrolase [Pararhodobacter sp.]
MTRAAPSPRLAARAIIVEQGRLLIVNAYPGDQSDLWCAPGGGVERGASLHDNLTREIHEELGLHIAVGEPCLVNEFHDPSSGFHQVDLYFRAHITGGMVDAAWQDPAGVVNRHRFVTEAALHALRFKPDSLPDVAFGPAGRVLYDPLEVIVI